MDFGISFFQTDETFNPPTMARMVEERGFESLFVTDHTHIPASRDTPWPVGGELPREYARTHDPFIACMAAASATETLNVGTAVALVMERDPIVTAKQVADIDVLSGGRMILGVGAGWNVEEMANHGTDATKRFGILRERVEAIREIWTSDEASYHGTYVDFERIWCWPKPSTPGGPPILIGGNGRTVYERVLAYGDGWLPNRIGDDEKIIGRVEKLQRLGREVGRDSVPVTMQLPPREHSLVERYEKAGVTRFVYMLPAAEGSEVERKLDQFTESAKAYAAAGG